MKRNLKIPLLAVMAVGALSAIGAAGAQATEFDCDTANCTIGSEKDGTGTTAHHVIDVPGNGPATCNEGQFIATGQPFESTTMTVSAAYSGCTWLGQPASITMNSCRYTFTAHGAVSITGCAGTKIEIEISGCVATIGDQSLSGITDSGEPGLTVTISLKVEKMHMVVEGPTCITQGTFTTGVYTTGNAILRGYDPANPSVQVNVDWDTATSD